VVKVICGLGNPGQKYDKTRHNLGFEVIDRLASRLPISRKAGAESFEYCSVASDVDEVFLIKPKTHVNRSGLAAREALRFFDMDAARFFVISDDFQLPLGSLRIRRRGSSGGHNGLQSIIDFIGESDFPRMRLGIGPLPAWAVEGGEKIPEFVLGRFATSEREMVEEMLSRAVEAVETVINESLELAISIYNRINPTPED